MAMIRIRGALRERSAIESVALQLDQTDTASLYNHVKCNTLDAVGGSFQCNGLTKNEICSIAALPEVREIVAIVPFDYDFTPKPDDAFTTTAATINLCTPNIIPEPTIAAATPSACDKPVEDVDYEGNDIKFTQRSNSDDCCDDCTKTPGCVAYVWTAWNDGTCFLKSNADKSVPKKGAKAAKVANSVGSFLGAATPSACDKPVEDVDYEGNDIKFTQRSNSDDCLRTYGPLGTTAHAS
ncbi:hypothetical protein DYB34_013023 [Aphanomyces astaci]|uniref:Apple domain-containing protein n=1 Tax=Aphanomyces astaci TaxID=112090 RepID=A0A3R6W2X3_APHAT|nr:hypothetical protein DYB34_013023 [Aphanomyces astaci]